jgi:Transglycosylase SLT domain
MRAILALAILLLGLSSAIPEPEYSSSQLFNAFELVETNSRPSLIEIESSIGKGDRLVIAALPQSIANAQPDPEQPPSLSEPNIPTPISLGELCNALFTSAQDNHLPVTFFANLIWQESGLQKDVISRKGAMGIAQFMPQTAAEHGLGDPFDPLRSISASARLLRELRNQFGNLGYVAAAYNAGPRRVSEWLGRGRRLPRETLSYVVNVTGRSVDEWQKTPPDDAALHFVQRLPCRDMSAFAALEQAQSQQAQADQAHAQPTEENTKTPEAADATPADERKHRPRNVLHRALLRVVGDQQRGDRNEAKEHRRRSLHEHGRV